MKVGAWDSQILQLRYNTGARGASYIFGSIEYENKLNIIRF